MILLIAGGSGGLSVGRVAKRLGPDGYRVLRKDSPECVLAIAGLLIGKTGPPEGAIAAEASPG